MKKTRIQIVPENCTGCLRCQLACSDLYTKTFNPAQARVRVEPSGVDFSISFTEECNDCGVCAEECFYGALQKRDQEAAG